MYVSFVEGFSFTYEPKSSFSWPTVHGFIALAVFCACSLPTLVVGVVKCWCADAGTTGKLRLSVY